MRLVVRRVGRISKVDFRKKGRILPVGLAVLVVVLLAALTLYAQTSSLSQAAGSRLALAVVPLGTATSFAVLGGSEVTNTGHSVVTGDLGVSPGSSVTGFPPGIVNGNLHSSADFVTTLAQINDTATYLNLKGQSCPATNDLTGKDLGGLTLNPGVYCFSSSAGLTGKLTLNAQNDPSSIFIFQIGSSLTTASDSSVVMMGGGNYCNVYWQVTSSATLGTTTSFKGNILALASITLNNGASVSGRVLAQTAAVTMDNNRVDMSACGSTTTSTTSSTTSQSSTSTSSSTTTSSSTNTSIPSTVYLTVKANGTHFVDIWANGVQTSSGFTNTSLAVTQGQNFTVGAFDNGCYRFSHWTDGSTQRFRNMSITANSTLTAAYSNICLPLPAGYSNINITTVDSSGSAISGYYTTLWQNGALLQSCFSSCSFAVSSGTYQVAVSDSNGLFFNHWTDGSTVRFHTVIVGSSSSKINLTAVYGTTAPMNASGAASLLSIVSTVSISATLGSILALTYVGTLATVGEQGLRALGRIGGPLG